MDNTSLQTLSEAWAFKANIVAWNKLGEKDDQPRFGWPSNCKPNELKC
jgi:hypothetical protein